MADDPALTVVIPLRNRAGLRLENCLRSLRWQEFDQDFEVVLSDFGSDPSHRDEIAELATVWDARIVRSESDAVWNRARALNIGIRRARGRFVLCTDADMIFAPNFVSTLVAHQEGDAMVVCRCRDLPSTVDERAWHLDDFPTLLGESEFRERLGTGACQMAPRSFFERVHGYDERYVFWGCEDADMFHRSQRAGLQIRWVHEQTSMLHQWHRTTRHDRPVLKALNDARFHLTKWIVVKNRWGWGRP